MAIIDTLRFRNILVDGKIADEAPAQEFVTALDEAFEEHISGLATKSDMALQTAGINTRFAEVRAQMAALEARMTWTIMWTAFGLLTALTAIMTLLQVLLD